MKARKLKDDITIGVFSSSSPISATVPVRYERGVKYLESKGYKIINGQLYRKKDNYRSGTIQERAQEFNQLLYNEDVQILMASIGGNNTNSSFTFVQTLIKCIISSFYMCFVIDYPHNPIRS